MNVLKSVIENFNSIKIVLIIILNIDKLIKSSVHSPKRLPVFTGLLGFYIFISLKIGLHLAVNLTSICQSAPQ
jgi:hypothetical protein